jgi:hypothetical protein
MRGLGVGRLPSAGFVTLTAILLIMCLPASSDAQSYPSSGSLEVGGGGLWVGGSDAGAATAEETQNQTGAAGSIALFDTNARLASAPGVGGRIGFNLTSTIALEGELIYSRPQIAVSISNDFEGASDVTLENSFVHQYFIDGGIVVHVNNLRFNARGVPFFRAGIGYLRQLTEGRQAIETGQVYQVGGGFKQLVGTGQRFGVRFDVRAAIRKGGLSFDEHGQHAFVVLGGSVFVVF